MIRRLQWLFAVPILVSVGCKDAPKVAGSNDDAMAVQTKPMAQPTLGAQLDRAGRVAVSTGLIHSFNPDAASKAAGKMSFNQATPSSWQDHASEVAKNLAIMDGLDTVCGNQLLAAKEGGADRYKTLASVLMDDQIYVDTSRGVCGQYLGLEAELVGALPEGKGGCGGRTLTDDVIETTYSVLAIGALSGLDDTLTSDGAAHSNKRFPFLAAPPEER